MPTYETLQALKSDLKCNASLVDCSLGGVLHGYLGALITPAAYAIAGPNYPFIKPVFPGYQATLIPTRYVTLHCERTRQILMHGVNTTIYQGLVQTTDWSN
jgi:hypothetical protein